MVPSLPRRSVLRALMVLPFQDLYRLIPSGEADIHPGLAVDLVRLINTVERGHKIKFGTYAGTDELTGSEILRRMARGQEVKNSSLDASSKARMEAHGSVPGWRLRLHLPTGRGAYLATLRTAVGAEFNALATDESGVIYRGRIRPEARWPDSYAPIAHVREGLLPLGTPLPTEGVRSHLASLLRRAAFLSISFPQHGCAGTCTSSGQCFCYNYGCGDCPWCCYGYCSDCAMHEPCCSCCTACIE